MSGTTAKGIADSPVRSRTVWLCAALHGFTHLYWVVVTPLYLLMAKDLTAGSLAEVTFLVTVMMVAYYLPAYGAGVLADRFSPRGLLAGGLAVQGLAIVGLGLTHNLGQALVWAAVSGLGGSLYHPAATTLVARLYPTQTGRALGLVGLGAGVGFCLGPLYAGWRAATAGWRAPLIECGLAGVAMAVVFWWLAEMPSADAKRPTNAAECPGPDRRWWLALLGAAFLLSLRDFAGSAVGSGAALFLPRAHGFSPAATGAALSLVFLGSIAGNPVFGRMADRRLASGLTMVLLVAGLAAAALPWLPAAVLLPALLVYGFFFMGSYPMTEAAVVRAAPAEGRGRAMGVFIMVGGLLGNLAHWWAGYAIERLGAAGSSPAAYRGFFLVCGVMIVLSLTSLPWLRRRSRKAAAGPALSVTETTAPVAEP
ncbi:MAG: MFS transporter [Verrucomicrobia bacterium]|nr:MAG: MFS transporter [Verrucomicrobiota bacterium]